MVTNFEHYTSQLLKDQLPALAYNGNSDCIYNFYGNQVVAVKLSLIMIGMVEGWARSLNGLSLLQVYGADHMVPQV